MLKEYLTNIANTIRNKLGITTTINAQDFATKIDEVYDAGKASMVDETKIIEKTVKGNTLVSINDVSEIPHDIGVKLKNAENLIPIVERTTKTENIKLTLNNNQVSIYNSGVAEGSNRGVWSDNFTLPTGTYTFSIQYVSGSSARAKVNYVWQGIRLPDDSAWICTIGGCSQDDYNQTKSKTFTLEQDTEVRYFLLCNSIENEPVDLVIRIQLEVGNTATPYITDFSGIEVKRYEKNLFEFKQGFISSSGGEILEELENGAVLQGVKYNDSQWNSWGNGWYSFENISTVSLKAGDVVTLSCDYTLLELAEGRTDATDSEIANKKVGMYLSNGTANNLYLYPANQPKLGQTIRCYVTGTIKEDDDYSPIFTINSNKARIENIQIEYGDTTTPYQPYTEPQTAMSTADGTVEDITSISPTMNIIANSNVGIEVKYHKSWGMDYEWDRFWGAFQSVANTHAHGYDYAFMYSHWKDNIFKPKYDIVGTSHYMAFMVAILKI